MDSSKLIVTVQEYEELYNLKHSQYSNQQRRDNIWEEIGRRLNHPSGSFKSQWTRIRDNHRKALQLRKTKSGQAASKMKPPKFFQELQFLTPFISDEEGRISNLTNSNSVRSSVDSDDDNEYDPDEATTTLMSSSLEHSSSSSIKESSSSYSNSSRLPGRRQRTAEQGSSQPSVGAVLQNYLQSKKDATQSITDPLMEFFNNMARTVKTFPIQSQIRIKGQLFEMVHNEEMRLAEETLSNNLAPSSASTFYPPCQSQI